MTSRFWIAERRVGVFEQRDHSQARGFDVLSTEFIFWGGDGRVVRPVARGKKRMVITVRILDSSIFRTFSMESPATGAIDPVLLFVNTTNVFI